MLQVLWLRLKAAWNILWHGSQAVEALPPVPVEEEPEKTRDETLEEFFRRLEGEVESYKAPDAATLSRLLVESCERYLVELSQLPVGIFPEYKDKDHTCFITPKDVRKIRTEAYHLNSSSLNQVAKNLAVCWAALNVLKGKEEADQAETWQILHEIG